MLWYPIRDSSMVTIKELAEILGISRGTVDRVLHNRGKVSPEIREKVLAKAKELNYQPNRAGLMLALRKQPHRIGALVPSVGNPFFVPLIEGMRKATEEYRDLGFSLALREVKGFDRETHISLIRELIDDEGCDGIVITTMDDPSITDVLSSSGLPVIAVNSDISMEKLCYVGPDYYAKGALHAGLLVLTGRKSPRILILRGSEYMRGHGDIVRGFKETLERKGVPFTIAGEYDTEDDNELSEMIVREKLREDPSIDTLFITTAGMYGAEKGTDGKDILIFTSDDIPVTKTLIRSGRIGWTICQEPFRQGQESVRRMQDWFIDGSKPQDLYTQHVVKILENIDA